MIRPLVMLSLVMLMLGIAPAFAAEVKPFDAKAFEAAQAAGESVVVDVHATW